MIARQRCVETGSLIFHRKRVREVGQGGQVRGHQGRLTRSGRPAVPAGGLQLSPPAHAAWKFAANVMPVIREIQAAGAKSNAAIAAKLNERRVPTARGGVWAHVQVRSVISRSVA
jgi:hypothetical protein